MIPIESRWLLIHEKAMSTLSLITYPNCPVTWIFWRLLRYWIASTVRTFPPIWVQAKPLTTPTPPQSVFLCRRPKYSSTLSLVMTSLSPFLTTFLQILAYFLSSSLTPSSPEYLIIYLMPSGLNSTKPSAPFYLSWIGIRWLIEISYFSSRVYPGTSIN